MRIIRLAVLAALVFVTGCGACGGGAILPMAAVGSELATCLAPPQGVDARAALQSWINNACGDLDGTYTVVTPPGAGVRVGLTLRPGQRLAGAGSIRFVGDVHGDWRGIRVVGTAPGQPEAVIEMRELDASAMVTDDEQSHLIEAYRARLTIRNTTLRHPQKPLPSDPTKHMPGGDCIRFLGRNATETQIAIPAGGLIENVNFAECDRSGVAIQYETRGLKITNSTFGTIGDSAIDTEVTAGSASDIDVDGNTMGSLDEPHSSPCISASAAPGPVERVHIANNMILGCGIDALNAVDLVITTNTIMHNSAGPTLNLRKAVDGVVVENNIIEHLLDSGHSAIQVGSHNSGSPGHIVLRNNHLMTAGAVAVVSIEDVIAATLDGNTFVGDHHTAVAIRGVTRPVETALVMSNDFYGPFTTCVRTVDVGAYTALNNTSAVVPCGGL